MKGQALPSPPQHIYLTTLLRLPKPAAGATATARDSLDPLGHRGLTLDPVLKGGLGGRRQEAGGHARTRGDMGPSVKVITARHLRKEWENNDGSNTRGVKIITRPPVTCFCLHAPAPATLGQCGSCSALVIKRYTAGQPNHRQEPVTTATSANSASDTDWPCL